MRSENGKLDAALHIGSGNDAARFDRDQAFASCRDGSLTVIGEKGGHFEVQQTVQTGDGARITVRNSIMLISHYEPSMPSNWRLIPWQHGLSIVLVSGQEALFD